MLVRAVLCVVAVVPFLTACRDAAAAGNPVPNRARTLIASHGKPPEKITDLPREQWPAFIDSAYRLVPDRRFLSALGEIDAVRSGEAPQVIEISFENGRWTISEAGDVIGSLPESPSYREAMALLDAHINKHRFEQDDAAPAPIVDQLERAAKGVDAVEIIVALQAADAEWRACRNDPRVYRLAARALTHLAIGTLDNLEASDQLLAKAMALTAIARSFDRKAMIADEVLLAGALSYTDDAAALARGLRTDDPVRLYALRQDDALRAVAEASGSTPWVRLLFLKRFAYDVDADTWLQWVTRFEPAMTAPVIRVMQVNGTIFSDEVTVAQQAQLLTLAELSGRRATSPAGTSRDDMLLAMSAEIAKAGDPTQWTAQFETDLAARAGRSRGPLLDEATFRSYFEANFFTALLREGSFYKDTLASAPDTNEFVPRIGGKSDIAVHLAKWFDVMSRHTSGERIGANAADLIAQTSRAGAEQLEDIERAAFDALPREDATRRTIVRRLLETMDTRPMHETLAADALDRGLFDIARAEELYARSFARWPYFQPTHYAWFRVARGDRAAVEQFVRRRDIDAWDRARLLKYAWNDGLVDVAFVRSTFETLITQGDVSTEYADVLVQLKDFAAAERLMRAWLVQHPEAPELSGAENLAWLSQALRKQGRTEEAWMVIAPVLETWKEIVLEEATFVLESLGRTTEAVNLGEKLVERYGDGVSAHAVLARVHWRAGRNHEAAAVLDPQENHLLAAGMLQQLPPAFAEVFAGKPPAAAEAAMQELLAANVPNDVAIATAHELANVDEQSGFGLVRMILEARGIDLAHTPGSESPAVAIDALMPEYRARAKKDGEAAAAQWLTSQIPAPLARSAAFYFFQRGRSALLWAIAPRDDEQVSSLLSMDLMRRGVGPADPESTSLRNYFASRPAGTYFTDLAKVVFREAPPDLLKKHEQGEVAVTNAYVFALVALRDGRYAEASRWLQAAYEAGGWQHLAGGWAVDQLLRWQEGKKTFAEITATRFL